MEFIPNEIRYKNLHHCSGGLYLATRMTMFKVESFSLQELLCFAKKCKSLLGLPQIHHMTLQDIQCLLASGERIDLLWGQLHEEQVEEGFSVDTSKEFTVQYMVCCSALMTFQQLIESLQRFTCNNHTQTSIQFWIDSFSLPFALSPLEKATAYKMVLQQCKDKVLLLSPWDYSEVFFNLFSVIQLVLSSSNSTTWTVSMGKEERQRLKDSLLNNCVETERCLLRKVRIDPLVTENDGTKEVQECLLGHSDDVGDYIYYTICSDIERWLLKEIHTECSRYYYLPKKDVLLSLNTVEQCMGSTGGIYKGDNYFKFNRVYEQYLIHCINEELQFSALVQEFAKCSTEDKNPQMAWKESCLQSFLMQLGKHYMDSGNFDKAEDHFSNMLKLQRQGRITTASEVTLKLADALAMLQKYTLAEMHYLCYLKDIQLSKDVNTKAKLLALQHVGNFFYARGRFDQAETLLDACYDLAVQLHGPVTHQSLQTGCLVASVKQRIQQYDEALHAAARCVQVAKVLYPVDSDAVHHYESLLGDIMEEKMTMFVNQSGIKEAIPLAEVVSSIDPVSIRWRKRKSLTNRDAATTRYCSIC